MVHMGLRIAELPHVVVVGGGFGGLAAARALKRLPVRVTLIDKTNHHLFQPLLYQVATATLMPGQIAAPIRQVLKAHRRVTVLLAEVTQVDPARHEVEIRAAGGEQERIGYDFLILATGVQHSYFGQDSFARFAPGLKTMPDATEIRNRILAAYEAAEGEADEAARKALLTFVMVGGGPTGVEMAGAIAELARLTMKGDFRRIDPGHTRIVLVEAGPRILPAFAASLAASAARRLESMGVEVITGRKVEHIDERGCVVGGARVESRNVIWTAGVAPSPAAAWLGLPPGKVRVRYDLSAPNLPEVFVIGDVAYYEQGGRPLPGVAQVAMQMGCHVARVIQARLHNDAPPPPFHYTDKGNMAVVGRNFAIFERGKLRFSGPLGWLMWSMIHILFLALPNMRLTVFWQWIWSYFTEQRGSRLIVDARNLSSPAGNGRSAL
jgi:NADH dehydrogenase FAD-containing subunit